MGTVRALLHDLREVATRERTEGTTRRRPGDAARAVLAALLLVPLILHAHHPTATEEAVVRLFDSIPAGAKTLFLILYQLAALWAVGLLVVTVLLLRRWRLARDLAVAAVAALGARPAHGLPRARRRPVAGVQGHVRPHRRAALPDGAAHRWRWRRCWWRRHTSPGPPAASARGWWRCSRCRASTCRAASPPTSSPPSCSGGGSPTWSSGSSAPRSGDRRAVRWRTRSPSWACR